MTAFRTCRRYTLLFDVDVTDVPFHWVGYDDPVPQDFVGGADAYLAAAPRTAGELVRDVRERERADSRGAIAVLRHGRSGRMKLRS